MRTRTDDAARILHAAVAAADPRPAVQRAVASLDLAPAADLHIVAIGKAAAGMVLGTLDALPNQPRSALAIVPHGTPADSSSDLHAAGVQVLHASHPLPDASSAAAGAAVENLLVQARPDDIVLVLLSGGASALCVAPIDGLDVPTYANIVRVLMHAGADIRELNTVRARIDRMKGGGMARLLAPARTIGLVVSDVVGNPLDVIASGPLTQPRSSPADARAILEQHGLDSLVPYNVKSPPDERASYDHVTTHVILDNSDAHAGAAAEARRLGYTVHVVDEPVTGSARDAGRRIARTAMETAAALEASDGRVCIIAGGETTVSVTGTGVGGRNQELVLAAAIALNGTTRITVGSIGTDGVDGPTDAAGAVADGTLVTRAANAGLNAAALLENNDSHSFFRATGGLLRTGPTGTNVMDVQVALIQPPD